MTEEEEAREDLELRRIAWELMGATLERVNFHNDEVSWCIPWEGRVHDTRQENFMGYSDDPAILPAVECDPQEQYRLERWLRETFYGYRLTWSDGVAHCLLWTSKYTFLPSCESDSIGGAICESLRKYRDEIKLVLRNNAEEKNGQGLGGDQ